MQLKRTAPPAHDFARMRADCGWGPMIPLPEAERSLAAGLFNTCAYVDGTLAGFGRVVGDGVLYFYLQDIIVEPAFRGQGIGRAIVDDLLAQIEAAATITCSIGLMSVEGKEALYQASGFQSRPAPGVGAGMTQFIIKD